MKTSNRMVTVAGFGTLVRVGRDQVLLEYKIYIFLLFVSKRQHKVLSILLVDVCIDYRLKRTHNRTTPAANVHH